jgi:serine/threonine protein kinase/tetratricopeptide (TPR) repeat protein
MSDDPARVAQFDREAAERRRAAENEVDQTDSHAGGADTFGTTASHHPEAPDAGDPLRTTDHENGSASTDGTRPKPAASAGDLPDVPGYRVVREIARGGMGRVLAAYDLLLGRDVALKVLLPRAKADRFIRESKITARLPHPGIPPVHALGTLADGSPFMAMKLVAGQTLAAEMKTADRPHLLHAFVQVCQAVGFAHSRGVIHRDLKPANIMIGAFGEVQVMDWGLAKDFDARETTGVPSSEADFLPRPATDSDVTADFHDSTEELTAAGKIMGTPEYMAPEQARGEPADARTDVFALGGILCKILTGHSPFGGRSSLEAIRLAGAADLAEANARLVTCGADPELVAVCRRCLSPDPSGRPTDGRAVADELTTYLNGVQERLQASERERAVAAAKTIEERRRRKMQVIAASLVLVVLVAGITGTTIGLFNAREQRAVVEARNGQLVEEKAHTEAEWNRAEKNFETARSLVFDMGNQINQLESGRRNPRLIDLARKKALDDARMQFDLFRAGQPGDLEIQLQAADLHRFAANVSRTLSDNPSAISAYGSSIRILEELMKREPDDIRCPDHLAQTLKDRALLEKLTGKLKESAATLDRALSISEGTKGRIDESFFRRTVGVIELERSSVAFSRGQFDDADQYAARARTLIQELLELTKDLNRKRQAFDPLLAVICLNLDARICRERGRIESAWKAHEDAAGRMKVLLKADVNPDHLFWDGEVRRERAVTALAMPEHRAAAAADLVEVVQTLEKLVDDYPNTALYREKLAAVLTVRGELLLRLDQSSSAATEVTKSLAVSRELIDRFGGVSASMLVRGNAYMTQGRVQAAASKLQDATASWKNASTIFERAVKIDPENFQHRRGAAEAERERKRIGS